MLWGRILAIVIIFGLGITIFRKYFFIIVGLVLLWFLIRWIADIFWWGRDKGKW